MAKTVEKPKLNLEATLAAVVSHPIRIRCLVALSERTASATMLMRAWGLTKVGLVSYHVEKLEQLGFVEEVRSRPVRGSVERFYRAVGRPIFFEKEWGSMSQEEREQCSRYVLQLHVTDVALAVDQGTFDSRTNRALMRTPMTLDAEGFEEMHQHEFAAYQERLEIQARAMERIARRRHEGEEPGEISVVSTTMFYEAANGAGELGGAMASRP